MPLIRPNALRSLQSSLRYSGARATARAAPSRTQIVAKRFASSGHGGHGAPSSDLPWLLSGIAITIPSCWYLWPEQAEHGHGHGHGDHAEHGEGHEEKEEESSGDEEQASGGEEEAVENADEKKEDKPEVKSEEASEEKSEDKSEEKSDDKKEEKSEDKSDDKEGGDEKKDDKTAGKGGDRTFTVGAKSEDGPPETEGSATTTSKTGQKLGEGSTSKPRGSSEGDMSKKQEGMSNTDTKHSIPIDSSTEKSTKSDGSPDTAKSKGTVDISKPPK